MMNLENNERQWIRIYEERGYEYEILKTFH